MTISHREPASPGDFRAAPFFALRTPLLPWEEFERWGLGLAAAQASDPQQSAEALARDRQLLRERLREVVQRPEVRDALTVASPSLAGDVGLWLESPDGERGRKVERSLVRYFVRMSTRPTPFGLFAGCSVGAVADESALELSPRDAWRRHARPDMDVLTGLVQGLVRDPVARRALRYRPSTGLYRVGDRIRYIECRTNESGRSLLLVSAEWHEGMEAAIQSAVPGATLSQVAEAASAAADASPGEAEAFADELALSQILEPEIAPPLTGPEPLPGLCRALRDLPGQAVAADSLEAVSAGVEELRRCPIGTGLPAYADVRRRLHALVPEATPSRTIQVDLAKPARASLGPEVVAAVLRGVEVMHRLWNAPRNEKLERFRSAFRARYEWAEVPLLEVLDEDIGIGFVPRPHDRAQESPLLVNLPFAEGPEPASRWSARERHLLGLLGAAQRQGLQEIVLEESDLRILETADRQPLPESCSALAVLLARSPEALRQGDFRVQLQSVWAPGARLLARFCHSDPELERHVRDMVAREKDFAGDALLAEIVHLPEGRLGNILLRPAHREHEIPYLGRSSLPEEQQIAPSDLLVSLRGDRIILRSRRLGREIIPRLTNAHLYTTGLPLYHFLGSLQEQGAVTGMRFSWGLLGGASSLPRVVAHDVVLAPARWRLDRAEQARLPRPGTREGFREVQRLRERLGLPRRIFQIDGDNRMLLDLDNPLLVDLLLHEARKPEEMVLEEVLADPHPVAGPGGTYAHEIVLPLLRSAPPSRPARKAPSVRDPSPRAGRVFSPGSEWLYAKLYLGPVLADEVLAQAVAPLARRVLASGLADGWFFIRYADPDWHLRLRFHGQPDALLGRLLPSLREAVAPWLDDGRLWKLQLDTYEREVDRYGGPEGIALAERAFCVDSQATCEILEALGEQGMRTARWQVGLRSADALLNDAGLVGAERRGLLEDLGRVYRPNFKKGPALDAELGRLFRAHRGAFGDLFGAAATPPEGLLPALAAIRDRSARLAPILAGLRKEEARGTMGVPVARLVGAFMHMSLNRLLRAAANPQELVIYDMLRRIQETREALARRQ